MPRLRNAYLDIKWAGDLWAVNLRAGQDNSLVMPIYAAPVTNDPLLFFEKGFLFNWDLGAVLGIKAGNGTSTMSLVEGSMVRCQAGNDSVSYNLPGTTSLTTAFPLNSLYPGVNGVQVEERGAGEASKRPGWRGRLTVKLAPSKLFSTYLGVTGHYQIEKQGMNYQLLTGNPALVLGLGLGNQVLLSQKIGKEVVSKSAGAFARVTIAMISFVGAGYMGWNMDAFVGGLGQGAVESTSGLKMVAVPVTGGYAQAQIFLAPVGIPITLAAGVGKVQKKNMSSISIGQILANRQIQGLITFHLNQYIAWSWEVSQLETKYKGRLGSDTNMAYRSQLSFTF